jgi:hypothetical protein
MPAVCLRLRAAARSDARESRLGFCFCLRFFLPKSAATNRLAKLASSSLTTPAASPLRSMRGVPALSDLW